MTISLDLYEIKQAFMNSIGTAFRISIYGESHGKAVGIIIDGLPPGISLNAEDFIHDLERRKPGARGTTSRKEDDLPQLISGIYKDYTTGSPLHILFENHNVRSEDYDSLKDIPRPGHADYVAHQKYRGYNDPRGGGHFSGRLTLALVAAGVIAKKIIDPVVPAAKLIEAGGSNNIDAAVDRAISEKDSIGGIVECIISNVPVGLGEPMFNSIESMISHLVFSIPAIKGIEFGSGFSSGRMKGSEHNDMIIDINGKTKTNHAGGINGGISNGNEIVFRVAVKPTSSIGREQESWNRLRERVEKFEITGRHDACIALRVPVVVEAVAAIVIADLSLTRL